MLKMNENRWISQGFKSGIVEVGKKLIMNAYTWKTRVLVLEKRALVLYSVVCLQRRDLHALTRFEIERCNPKRICELAVLPTGGAPQ